MASELFDRLDVAIHETVHGYVDPATRQKGAVALAPRVGVAAGTLSNKANPLMPDHKLGLAESVVVQVASGDYRILHAYAAVLRHCAYPLPETGDPDDVEVLECYALLHQRIGEKAAAVRQALADRVITAAEVAQIRDLFDEMVRAGLCLVSRLEDLAQ
jgi:hypothetical protein